MTFDTIYQTALRNEHLIWKQLDQETEVIKKDYIEEIRRDWEAEEPDESFDEYFDYHINDLIDFALEPYVLGIISETCGIDMERIEKLTSDEKHFVVLRTFNHFKELTGIGEIETTEKE